MAPDTETYESLLLRLAIMRKDYKPTVVLPCGIPQDRCPLPFDMINIDLSLKTYYNNGIIIKEVEKCGHQKERDPGKEEAGPPLQVSI